MGKENRDMAQLLLRVLLQAQRSGLVGDDQSKSHSCVVNFTSIHHTYHSF